MNKNDFSSIIQNSSKVETIPISIDNYNRMDKLCLQFTVVFKNCHRIFDTPFIKMWGLSSFPLNPGRLVSISTNRVQWKWCCVTSVDESLSGSFLWEPSPHAWRAKASWRACSQGTATFRATTILVTNSLSQRKSLLLDTDDDFPLVKDYHWPPLHPFQQQYLNTIQTIYSKVAKKQSKFQVEVFASIQIALDIPLEKQIATFQKKKVKFSSQQSQMVLVFMTSQPRHHTRE